MKNILLVLIALFVFTFTLNTFDNSKFQMNEFSNICHSIYSEKVWIDSCYLPTIQNKNTYELAMKAEVAMIAVILFGLLYRKKFNFKN